jgi:hypothetical protein
MFRRTVTQPIITLPKLRLFKPVGEKPDYPTLFDEWRATARKGLPSKYLHPIKHHYWRKWNLMTNIAPGPPVITAVRKNEYYSTPRSLPRNYDGRKDVRMTKVTKRELAGPAGDAALFL